MILIDSPGWGRREIEHIVLDFNGTLACDGKLLVDVDHRLAKLSIKARLHLCTADYFGTVADETRRFDLAIKVLKTNNQVQEKAEFIRRLGPLQVVAIGNGGADLQMLKEAALGIAVIGPEGACSQTIMAADVVCSDIQEALDLLLYTKRLASTLQR
ncbi:MAG: ATPase P [Deltaproteobacteria bacterium]|nr:ATPase P [Deltaproteobacteria bacterium]MBW1870416.1 ATPase P [Deltaproteobacteria bacterium]